jgi:DNA-directed RNA polymerase subunit F
MKSTYNQLLNRGFLNDHDYKLLYGKINNTNISEYLSNSDAHIRTAAIRRIKEGNYKDYLNSLCNLLQSEKKLYTRMELCECIAAFGRDAISILVPLLGKIGSNQHRIVDNIDLKKKSYPLPRDIVARIIAQIGPQALPELKKVLSEENKIRISEAIDAIGHIAFNYNDLSLERDLIELYGKNNDTLLEWKIIRAFQGFPTHNVKKILEEIVRSKLMNKTLVNEAERSLLRIKEREDRPPKRSAEAANSAAFAEL